MTDIFIFITIGAIAVFDAIVVIRKGIAITTFFQRWYVTFIFVPYSVGVVFLGHFGNYINLNITTAGKLWGLIGFSIPVLILSIILDRAGKELPKRIYGLIPIAAGYLVGDLFWQFQ